jgi:type I restriction enzyme S subunit
MTDVNWLPDALPDGWRVARMIDHVRLMNGYPFDSALFTAEQGTPLVRIRDLGSATTEVCYAGAPVPEAEIDRGAVLVGMDGDFNVARWAGGKALLNQRVCCLTPCATLDAAFLAFFLPAPLKIINDLTGSTTVKHLSSFDILKIRFPLPPLSVQTRISAHLEAIAGRIDNLLAEKERLIDLLAEKRKAIIATAVTRGLDPKVKLRDSGVPWLGEIPAHWRSTRVGRLFRQSKILGYPDLTVLSVYREFGVIERASRDDNANRVPDDLSKYQLVEVGDLVINKMKAWQGSLGVSDFRGITSPDYVVFRPVHSEEPRFLHSMLRMPQLTTVYLSISNGIRINQWRIEPERFANVEVFLPPVDEQRAIIDHIARETAKLDAVRAATERTIALLKERRAAVIAAAVTGQLDVGAVS